MNHADVQAAMADYLEGDLAISKRALFDAHLDRCPDCSLEIEEMRETIFLLRGLPDPEPPSTLAADVMRRIRHGEAEPGWLDRIASWVDEVTTPRVMVPVAAFAAGMAVVLITGQVSLTLPGGTPLGAETTMAALDSAPAAPPAVATAAAPPAAPVAPPPVVTRLASRPGLQEFPLLSAPSASSSRGEAMLGPVEGQAPIANFVRARGAGSPLVSPTTGMDPEERRRNALDSRLDELLRSPSGFAQDLASFDAVEQEVWIRILAERAGERGDSEQVLLALASSDDAAVEGLAARFSDALSSEGDPGGQ